MYPWNIASLVIPQHVVQDVQQQQQHKQKQQKQHIIEGNEIYILSLSEIFTYNPKRSLCNTCIYIYKKYSTT